MQMWAKLICGDKFLIYWYRAPLISSNPSQSPAQQSRTGISAAAKRPVTDTPRQPHQPSAECSLLTDTAGKDSQAWLQQGGKWFLSQACAYQLGYSKSRRIPSLLWNPSTLAYPLALPSWHSHHCSLCPKWVSFISHSIIIHTLQSRFPFSMRGAEIVKTVQKLVERDEIL